MSRDERDRLQDLAAAIEAIVAHVERAKKQSALTDQLVHDAVLYQFVVVGEAVKHLAPETCAKAPEVPWRDVAALRDLIAHEYFRISIERILEVVERDLPTLREAVTRILEDGDGKPVG